MSDHEGDGLDLDRWEQASLPGSSIFSFGGSEVKGPGRFPSELRTIPSTGPRLGPQPNPIARTQQARFPTPIPRGALGLDDPANVNSPKGRHGHTRRGPNAPPPSSRAPPYSAAHNQAQRGEPFTGEFDLLTTWRATRAVSLRVGEGSYRPHPTEKFQQIMSSTGAFLKEPENDESKVLIWGTEEQVATAKQKLSEWEEGVHSAPKGIPSQWHKEPALDGRAEHRLEWQASKRTIDEAMKKADWPYAVEGVFLWPKHLNMVEFCNDNADVLNDVRDHHLCRIEFYQEGSRPQWIGISVTERKTLVSIVSRITNLIREYVARMDQLMKVNLIQYPCFSIYRQEVGLLDRDPQTDSYLPTLHGEPGIDEEELDRQRRLRHMGNRKKIKKTIDTCLKSLAISQRHVRMRVAFGELGFVQFQKPADEAESYSFDEFYSMVTKGRTKLSLNSLPVRQGNITDLPDILNCMDAFSNCNVSYGTFFDFAGSAASKSIVRLECVFGTISDSSDFEIREQRWVEVGESVGRLQIALFNFERPDYQLTIDAFPLYENKRIGHEQKVFQNNVTFEAPTNGIKSLPRMRVKFPRTSAGLHSVSEITTMRWRFKKTDGIFELRRKDTYDQGSGRKGATHRESRWHAMYYYPEWDNLMGQFANVQAGEDVKWVKSVSTFFPEEDEDYGLALPQGFKNFISEVEEIQDLLADAIAQLAKGKYRGQTNGALNGASDSAT